MRNTLRAMLLAFTIIPLATDVAIGQPDEPFDDDIIMEEVMIEEGPVRPRFRHRRPGLLNSPLTWAVVAGVMVVAVPLGVFKIVQQMRYCSMEQEREKAPWERAQAEFERDLSSRSKRPDAF